MLKPYGAKVFSLQIHFFFIIYSCSCSFDIILYDMVTLISSFILWILWKCYVNLLLSIIFMMLQRCPEKRSECCSHVCQIYKTLHFEHCTLLITSLAVSSVFFFSMRFNLSLVMSLVGPWLPLASCRSFKKPNLT